MTTIVAHEKDCFSVSAVQRLGKRGYNTRIIQGDNQAVPGEVALFSVNHNGMRQISFSGRHTRLAAHRLIEAGVVPSFALSTPYLVALREHPNPKMKGSLDEALRWFADAYDQFFAGKSCSSCPWGSQPTQQETLQAFRQWQQQSEQALTGTQLQAHSAFFKQVEPLVSFAFSESKRRIEAGLKSAVTALCFHATEDRNGIVESLDDQVEGEVISLIDQSPFESVMVHTFHPDDLSILSQFGLKEVVLKSLWNQPDELARHWELCEQFAARSPKVQLRSMGSFFTNHRLVKKALLEGKNRAMKMAQEIRKDPPPIFRTLSSSEQERRLMCESVLYLLMTEQYRESVYLGFEVHAAYWRSGHLYRWGDAFLPVLFAPSHLRQHWTSWAIDSQRRMLLAA